MKIVDGRSLGLWFDIERKRKSTSYFVLHWSGGSDSNDVVVQVKRVYDTLVARGDSITFICASDGTVVQVADLDAHCVHAGSAMNDRAPGVEVVCPGTSGVLPTVPRPKFTSIIRGVPVTYWGFTDAQVVAVAQLAQGVLWRYGLAYVSSPVCVGDTVSLPAGVIGHYQTALDKADPGPATMYQIRSKMVDSKLFSGLGLASVVGVGAWARKRLRPGRR